MDRFLRRRDGNFNQSENIIGPNNYVVISSRTKISYTMYNIEVQWPWFLRKDCNVKSETRGGKPKTAITNSLDEPKPWVCVSKPLTLKVSLRARTKISVVRLVV